jgi:hypothetical protein
MIFDDHEITDDWYITWDWCEVVLKKPLGRRVIQNGLLAYAVFQAWGNTPDQFAEGDGVPTQISAGKALLDAAKKWSESKGTNGAEEQKIAARLGIPTHDSIFTQDPENGDRILNRPPGALNWHYHLYGPNFEVIVLDTRTRRAYPGERFAPHSLICKSALYEQIDLKQKEGTLVTFVISATPAITFPFYRHWIVWLKTIWQRMKHYRFGLGIFLDRNRRMHPVYDPELADHWKGPKNELFELLLARLASRSTAVNNKRQTRVIILTGDVHFSAASRLQYAADISFADEPEPLPAPIDAVFVQLTSSGIKKMARKTKLLHLHGYKTWFVQALLTYFTDGNRSFGDWVKELPEVEAWLGWRKAIGVGFSPGDLGRVSQVWEDMNYFPWMLRDYPPMLKLRRLQKIIYPVPAPGEPTGEINFAKLIIEEDNENLKELYIPKPHWAYRIDHILAENEVREPAPVMPTEVNAPSPGDRTEALRSYLAMAKNHKDYAQKWGNGKEIVTFHPI